MQRPGKEFLTRTRWAGDQHRDIIRRNFADLVTDFIQRALRMAFYLFKLKAITQMGFFLTNLLLGLLFGKTHLHIQQCILTL